MMPAGVDVRPRYDRFAILILALSSTVIFTVFIFFDPVPQSASYYEFADRRAVLGIPNFWNVASNIPFVIFGGLGLWLVSGTPRLVIMEELHAAYVVLFAGIAMTGFGSAWFHLDPNNDTLFWDRLPMTIAFMPLLAIVVGEHVSAVLARKLLWPLLVAGTGSVLYWAHTESMQAGDLRLYGIVQFLPLLLIPAVLLRYPSAFDSARLMWHAIMLYALAKLFEIFDMHVFGFGEILSGHSIKHLIASFVPLVLVIGMQRRRRVA